MLSPDQARVAAGLPTPDVWSGLSADEREYRAQVLDRIAQRVAVDGVRVSAPSPDRGSQFMPFAALKGYEEVIAEAENGNVEEALDVADAQAEETSLRYQHDEVFESIREELDTNETPRAYKLRCPP